MLMESDAREGRVGGVEEDGLTEMLVERRRHRGMVGNVYKGRVTRVLPGMQAAFVDVGLERDAFLYVSDVAADFEAMEDQELGEAAADEPAARGAGGGGGGGAGGGDGHRPPCGAPRPGGAPTGPAA